MQEIYTILKSAWNSTSFDTLYGLLWRIFFSSRRRHTRCSSVSWARTLVGTWCWSQVTYAYPRLGIGFLASTCLGLSCLIAFFRLSSDAGLALVSTSPRQEKFFLKATSQNTWYICKKEQSVFHLSEPSAFTASFRENGQAVALLSKPCPLLKSRRILVNSQWLGLLKLFVSWDPRG